MLSILDLDCAEELMEAPEIDPLSVSKQKHGKKRLIFDLRHVNRYLSRPNSSVKMSLSKKRF